MQSTTPPIWEKYFRDDLKDLPINNEISDIMDRIAEKIMEKDIGKVILFNHKTMLNKDCELIGIIADVKDKYYIVDVEGELYPINPYYVIDIA